MAFFGTFAAVALPYPVSLAVAGGSASGRHFLTWQLFRPANHVWTFYPAVVPAAIGLPVLACAAGMLVLAILARRWSWRESLLVCWTIVPCFFFQLWPVKGYQYLLPVAAPVAVLAAGLLTDTGLARRLARGSGRGGRAARALQAGVVVAVTAWLALTTWAAIDPADSTSFLAGTGGVPGGRQAGQWIEAHTPAGAEMLSIGPSMANILQFYGHRRVLGMSVSPNPLHRNPAYVPVTNPDLLLRSGQVQYLVWDIYSAARSRSFASRLMTYTRRYRGTVVPHPDSDRQHPRRPGQAADHHHLRGTPMNPLRRRSLTTAAGTAVCAAIVLAPAVAAGIHRRRRTPRARPSTISWSCCRKTTRSTTTSGPTPVRTGSRPACACR